MLKAITIASAILLGITSAPAHLLMIAPNGGEMLSAGGTFPITWMVFVGHATENWDLFYSTEGPDGPWVEITIDLPAVDAQTGTVHTYVWSIPDVPMETVWARVVQDNAGTDYEAVSLEPFATVEGCIGDVDGSGAIGFDDLLLMLGDWGACAGCPADLDGDDNVTFDDLLTLLGAWGGTCG